MTIETILYTPQTITNDNTNGGRITHHPVVKTANGLGNVPAITDADRTNGVTIYRKLFAKCLGLTTATKLVIGVSPTPSNDAKAYVIAGTQRDTKAAIGTRKYAGGELNTGVNATDTVLSVDFEAGMGALSMVQAGDKLMVWDSPSNYTPIDTIVVDSVVWTGDTASITLTGQIGKVFSAGAFVASVILNTTDINAKADNYVKSLVGSTFDEVTYPVLVSRIGTDEETITLTALDSTTYSVISDSRGALPNGQFAVDYTYNHPDLTELCFKVQAASWGGSHTTGESVQFQIHPAAVPVWIVYIVNAGAAQNALEKIPLVTWLEGA